MGVAYTQIGSFFWRRHMFVALLTVVMRPLRTGAWSLGPMVSRRFIATAASSNRKSVYYINGNGRTGAGLENRGVLYAFGSNRIGPDRGRSSPRADQSLHTDGGIY